MGHARRETDLSILTRYIDDAARPLFDHQLAELAAANREVATLRMADKNPKKLRRRLRKAKDDLSERNTELSKIKHADATAY